MLFSKCVAPSDIPLTCFMLIENTKLPNLGTICQGHLNVEPEFFFFLELFTRTSVQ